MKITNGALISKCGECKYFDIDTDCCNYNTDTKRSVYIHAIDKDCPLQDVDVIENLGNTTIIDTIDNVIILDYPIEAIYIVKKDNK